MKRMDVDLNLLPILLVLLDERSVSRTAERLDLSQPSVSAALGKLRESMNDALFIRSGGSMEPTSRMLSLVQPIRDMVALVERDIVAAIEFVPERIEGCITVALSDVGEMVFLPRLLDAVRSRAPRASLQTVNIPHSALEDALESGAVDLAVGYFPDLASANIFQQRLFDHHFECLLRAGHPCASTDRLSEAQFLGMEHAVVRAPGRSQEIFEQFLKDKRVQRRVVLTTPNFLSIPSFLARTDLVVTVPHAVALTFGKPEYGLKAIRPPFDPPAIELKQHWHRKYHKAPRTVWLRELVSSLFNDETDEWKQTHGWRSEARHDDASDAP
jgi:DNA-binding transcriptional LysR family regulator